MYFSNIFFFFNPVQFLCPIKFYNFLHNYIAVFIRFISGICCCCCCWCDWDLFIFPIVWGNFMKFCRNRKRNSGQVFCRMSLGLGFVSWLGCGDVSVGKETTHSVHPSRCIIPGSAWCQHVSLGVNLAHSVKVVCARMLYYKVPIFLYDIVREILWDCIFGFCLNVCPLCL